MHMDYSDKMQTYIGALEEERRKILVFRRELPLCLELVTQGLYISVAFLRAAFGELGLTILGGCSEQTSTEGTPVLEEFIPVKRQSRPVVDGEDEEEEEQQSHKQMKIDIEDDSDGDKEKRSSSSADSKKKSDWLRSAQLWNQSPDPLPKQGLCIELQEHQPPRKVSVVEVWRNGGAFQPFQHDQKGWRCWSPELHRRFLQALQHLGGSHAATPKQIRELMKVDGLTNDEVKSHLQVFV